jgi:hypothetical protein
VRDRILGGIVSTTRRILISFANEAIALAEQEPALSAAVSCLDGGLAQLTGGSKCAVGQHGVNALHAIDDLGDP